MFYKQAAMRHALLSSDDSCYSLQYKFAVIVMGKLEYISDDDQDLKVNISQFLPHSLSGKLKKSLLSQ